MRELQAFQEEERRKKRQSMQEKHQRAEQLRVSQLEEKRKKAQMEEVKVIEITFINQVSIVYSIAHVLLIRILY